MEPRSSTEALGSGLGICAQCGPVATYVPDGALHAACWICGKPMVLGGAGTKIVYCEHCTQEGGDYKLETFYGDEL